MVRLAERKAEIEHVLATATSAEELSQALFAPDGLFASIARTSEERKALAHTPLFKDAQRRFSDLQRQEAAAFRERLSEGASTPQAPLGLKGMGSETEILREVQEINQEFAAAEADRLGKL